MQYLDAASKKHDSWIQIWISGLDTAKAFHGTRCSRITTESQENHNPTFNVSKSGCLEKTAAKRLFENMLHLMARSEQAGFAG